MQSTKYNIIIWVIFVSFSTLISFIIFDGLVKNYAIKIQSQRASVNFLLNQ